MARPTNCRYAPSHEWVRVEGNVGVIGITDFAVASLTDLTYVELPAVGTRIKKGQAFGEIESVKAAESLIAPVSGKVVAVNADVPENLDLVARAPFGDGWMVKVELADKGEVETLMTADAYARHVAAH